MRRGAAEGAAADAAGAPARSGAAPGPAAAGGGQSSAGAGSAQEPGDPPELQSAGAPEGARATGDSDRGELARSAAPLDWLLLVYRIPTEPTRHRATVWRRLKGLGAVYLQSSAAALPATPRGERALRTLRNEIVEQMAGQAFLVRGRALGGEADVVQAIADARNDEYEEIVDRCQDFLAEIEKEVAAEHFTYGELEENDEDLDKLQRWLEKVRDRDVLGAAGVRAAEAALERCTEALNAFAARVYEADSSAS